MSNSTTNITAAALTANVPSTDLGQQNFQSDKVWAWTVTGGQGWQIDDVIGFTTAAVTPASGDPYIFYHWIQWSTNAVPAAGNIFVNWVSYDGWDTLNTTATSNVNVQWSTTWTSATV